MSISTDICANVSLNKLRNEILYGRCAFGYGDEDRNKADGDDEGEVEDMGEGLGKEEEENGIDRNLEMMDRPTKKEVKATVNKMK